MEKGSPIISGHEALDAFLSAAAGAPAAAALLCDIDGTISPIAPRPADAHVPGAFRDLLAALVGRIGLVAFVTGRSLEDGRRMIPLEGAAYIGTHGLETMTADGALAVEPQAEPYVALIREVAEAAARDLDCEALGVVIEDKRTVLAVHYRLAEDAAATRHQILAHVIEPARERGLAIATGHFAFEVRPPLSFSKGTAVRRLLAGGGVSGRDGLRRRPHGHHRIRRHPRVGRAGRTAEGAGGRGGHGRDAATRDGCGRRAGGRHAGCPRGTRAVRGRGRRRLRLTTTASRPGADVRWTRQRPPNSGARFSRNALIPSVWSSLANASAKRSHSILWPVARSVSAAAFTAALQ